MRNPVEVVLDFLETINRHDVAGLVALISSDHVFIDSLGNRLQGLEQIKAGWQGYFKMCPDYTVSHDEIFGNSNVVAAFGSAGGTIADKGELKPENRWRIPSAWLATVRDSKITVWKVFADNKPVYEILNRMKNA